MTISDAVILADYGPPCSGPSLRMSLHGEGQVIVQPLFADNVLAFDACLRAANYRSRRADTGGYACRRKKRPDGTFRDEWSTHAVKGTIDLNWLSNPFTTGKLVTDYPDELIDMILGIRTNSGAPAWDWGGRWARSKDAMHWQPGCRRRDLVTGIDPRTVPGGNPPPIQNRPPAAPPVAFTGGPTDMRFFITDPSYGIRLVITDGNTVLDQGITKLEHLQVTDVGGPMSPDAFARFCKRYPGGRVMLPNRV